MLKEAIEKIVSLAGPKTFEADGHTYIADVEGTYYEVVPDVYGPEPIALRSLDAVVKMVRTEALKQGDGVVYITVPTHLKVEVFRSPLEAEERYFRPVLYRAEAADVPGWEPSVKQPFDQAAVALQTRFQEGGDREYTIDLLSMISTGAKVTYNDTGVATNVVTSKGGGPRRRSSTGACRARPFSTRRSRSRKNTACRPSVRCGTTRCAGRPAGWTNSCCRRRIRFL